ncbi:MAG TPA: M55 family metallopeptidase [Armatimonadota bacterium]|jgi:D-amino peptidase
MKIYIVADMEGIGGVFLPEQLKRGAPEYAEARLLLTGEVNAAIEGAFDGGATEVVVKDAHGSGFNIVLEDLDERAEIVAGGSVPKRLGGLDETFNGVFLLGYHAMAGTQAAICDHTMSSVSWTRYELCGEEVGETAIDAAWAGAHGVPVTLVTGDDKVCAEASALLGPDLVTCQTKVGLARHSVLGRSPKACRKLIREAARQAVSQAARPAPFCPAAPYEVHVTYVLTSGADYRHYDERTIREDARTVRYQGDDLLDVIERSLR